MNPHLFKNFIKPWYKRIFHKHYWLKTQQELKLETIGIYTEGLAYLFFCTKCPKTKAEVWYKRKKIENL